jgi:hypothetical protein
MAICRLSFDQSAGRGSRPAKQSRLSWDQRWRLVIREIACGRTSRNGYQRDNMIGALGRRR